MEKDSWTTAWIKGVIAGILCAIPWPVFGTAAGSFILIKSGIEEGIPMLLKRAKK